MRKVFLLVALSMIGALVLAAPAMAQDDLNCDDLSEAEEQAVFDADPSDPNNLDDDDDNLPCEDDDIDNGSFTLPAEETTMMEEPTSVEPTTVEPTSVEPTMMEETTMMVSAGPQSDEASPLPDTGGAFSPAFLSVAAAVLLVGGGITSALIVRRR